jgi:hypothetical protein
MTIRELIALGTGFNIAGLLWALGHLYTKYTERNLKKNQEKKVGGGVPLF